MPASEALLSVSFAFAGPPASKSPSGLAFKPASSAVLDFMLVSGPVDAFVPASALGLLSIILFILGLFYVVE